MIVTVDWSEKVLYRSEVEVDEDAVRLWLAGEDASKVDPQREITAEEVKDFLESGDAEDWKPTGNLDADWVMNDDTVIDGVDL